MNFHLMDDTVEELCESLREEPHSWNYGTFTMWKEGTSVRYLIESFSITRVLNGEQEDVVFSYGQGERIYEAFLCMKEKVMSVSQKSVQESLVDEEEPLVDEEESCRNTDGFFKGFFKRLFRRSKR